MNEMETETVRGMFADFLRDTGMEKMLRLDCCVTVDQDATLKYERIDKYKVLLLKYEELNCLMVFCARHDINVWFGMDKLCIGFNYTGNMRLSAYSVPLRELVPETLEDRIEPDHHLDVHGGVD
ncbi:MAG: hypothetical protein PHP06_05895 [Clostridia bacterium]|nr:hypothetical protein [Clostridia bacterium]